MRSENSKVKGTTYEATQNTNISGIMDNLKLYGGSNFGYNKGPTKSLEDQVHNFKNSETQWQNYLESLNLATFTKVAPQTGNFNHGMPLKNDDGSIMMPDSDGSYRKLNHTEIYNIQKAYERKEEKITEIYKMMTNDVLQQFILGLTKTEYDATVKLNDAAITVEGKKLGAVGTVDCSISAMETYQPKSAEILRAVKKNRLIIDARLNYINFYNIANTENKEHKAVNEDVKRELNKKAINNTVETPQARSMIQDDELLVEDTR